MPGVYISYPFCRQKCTYCNFASGVSPAAIVRDYVQALREEIHRHEWGWRPETVYLGGGSPSRMDADTLDSLLTAVPGAPWREATIEVAPGDVTRELAQRWARAGMTRVSLGVQSFVASEASATGRAHTPELVEHELRVLSEAGIRDANVDLIAGLPSQDDRSWEESLGWVERLGVTHVSVYMLEVDDDSRLGRELLGGGHRYGAQRVPDEALIVRLYEAAVSRLEGLGLRRYEISNFARPGHESIHNLKYWQLEHYVGFGADAHSFDGTTRWANPETAKEYVSSWKRGEQLHQAPTPANPDEERFFIGLRLRDGVVLSASDWRRLARKLRPFLENGLLEREGGRLRLTAEGVLLSNEVFQEFVGL